MRIVLAVLVSVFAFACTDPEPVEVISADLVGTADGNELTAVYGVTNTLDSGTVSIVIGTGKLNCGSQARERPPGNGTYLNLQIPNAVTGIPTEHFFQFIVIDGGDLNGRGSGGGTVEVTAVTEESIAVTVDYDELLGDATYQASGSFEVVRCD